MSAERVFDIIIDHLPIFSSLTFAPKRVFYGDGTVNRTPFTTFTRVRLFLSFYGVDSRNAVLRVERGKGVEKILLGSTLPRGALHQPGGDERKKQEQSVRYNMLRALLGVPITANDDLTNCRILALHQLLNKVCVSW